MGKKKNQKRNQKKALKKDQIIGKKPWLNISFATGFGLTALFLLYCQVFLPLRYETNDEFANIIRLVTQGVVTPEATSPVLSKILGHILIFLYKVSDSIPWYGIVNYIALYLGISLIIAVVIRNVKMPVAIFFLPVFFFYTFHCFAFVSFTAAALIIELGVLLSLLEWTIYEKCPSRYNLIYTGVLILGLMLGYMLRWELALWFLVFGFPIFLFVKKYQVKAVLPFVLALLAFVLVDRAMTMYGTTDQEKEYLVYNELRRVFHDTEKGKFHGDVTMKAIQQANWTFNDFSMFKRWILYDQVKFNTDTLKTFLAANSEGEAKSIFFHIPQRFKESYMKSKNYTLTFLFAVLAVCLLNIHLLKQIEKTRCLQVALTLGFIFSMIIFFAYYRFPPRIYVPLYLFSLGLVFLMMNNLSQENKENQRKQSLYKAMILIVAGVFIILAYKTAGTQAAGMKRTLTVSLMEKRVILNYLSQVKDHMKGLEPVIINMNPSDALGREFVHPLKELSEYSKDLLFVPTGTSINSPRYMRFLATLNLKSGREFLKWSIDNEQALFVFIVRDQQFHMSHVNMWQTFYNNRISLEKKVRLKPVFDGRGKNKNGIVFYRMESI